MYSIDDYLEARRQIFENIKRELLGPGSEDIGPDIECEVISDSPIERYSIGILFPQNNKINQDEEEKYTKEDEECTQYGHMHFSDDKKYDLEEMRKLQKNQANYNIVDEESISEYISMANQMLPSAMGMTFFVKDNINTINLRVKAAVYRASLYTDCCVKCGGKIPSVLKDYVYLENSMLKLKQNLNKAMVYELCKSEVIKDNYEIQNCLYKLAAQCSDEKTKKNGYVRVPLGIENPIKISLEKKYDKYEIWSEPKIQISVNKRKYNNGVIGITLMLVNDTKGNKSYRNTIFQPEIMICSEDNAELRFVEVARGFIGNEKLIDDEDVSLELLYRNKKTYSVGHGVATVEKIDILTSKGNIHTDFMPTYEVPKLDFNIKELEKISNKVLSMKNLSDISDLNKYEKIELLNSFIDIYDEWISLLTKEICEMDELYKKIAEKHINYCKECSQRMREGIAFLETDNNVYLAFSLMNRAMLMQRVHSTVKERFPYPYEKYIKYPKFDYKNTADNEASWRPFQLAFILMSIKGIAQPDNEERNLVDLIWIPTGGGKTEAYLGVSGFTIFLRRLKYPKTGGGTAIIMRYTLRLLAAQQFIRASIMICACEKIRREGKYNLGRNEISIGLWVGEPPTPNTNAKAKEYYQELIKKPRNIGDLNNKKEKNNLFQVLKCPWCGTKLEKEYTDNELKGQWGYDYQKRKIIFCPEEECEFNMKLPIQVVDEEIYKNPPTLLFGTVDKFATVAWKEEVSNLFAINDGNENKTPELIIQDELHLISGPLGTIVGLYETVIDSMCSKKGEKPKIIASTATIRRAKEQIKNLYNREVKQFPPQGLKIEDSFFTREIPVEKSPGRLYVGVMPSGKTQVTVEVRLISAISQRLYLMDIPEEIKDQYWTLVGYFNSIRELGKCSTLVNDDIKDNMIRLSQRIADRSKVRSLFSPRELTSRLTASAINKTLKDLEINYGAMEKEKGNYAVNILLASNMISVGVDVSRLNAMVVVGQPKLTSEYIQATSRVGRKNPGIVFTLYNGSKSRDRSHYEKFYSYHRSFYKYVEPTSITPFSEQSRERALHGVFISLVRHLLGLNSDDSAGGFDRNMDSLDKVKEIILNRAEALDNSIKRNLREEVEKELNEIIDIWQRKIDALVNNEILSYKNKKTKHLIKPFGSSDKENAFPTMQSMRNVDGQSKVDIIVFGDDENEED